MFFVDIFRVGIELVFEKELYRGFNSRKLNQFFWQKACLLLGIPRKCAYAESCQQISAANYRTFFGPFLIELTVFVNCQISVKNA